MEALNYLKKSITEKKHIVITMHHRPDGDALGSALALAQLCKLYGGEVSVISPSVYPNFLAWLPGIEEVIIGEKQREEAAFLVQRAEVIFCLDFGQYSRLGAMADLVQRAKGDKIIIDHHAGVPDPAKVIFCEPDVPATALLLYDLFVAVGLAPAIDKNIAVCLYVGLATDTNFFTTAHTTIAAHLVAAKLIGKGIDVGWVSFACQGNNPHNKMRFLANAILHRLTVDEKNQFAFFAIPRKDIMHFRLQSGDTGGLVNYALNLQNVLVAVLLTEQKNDVRLSFRSLGDNNVSTLAATHFAGGGHKNAAGGISSLSLEATAAQLTKQLSEWKKTPFVNLYA
ncbi:MAG: DHH family phosphoesterase [Bacteroidota bacterium]